jgi:pilus assembly protein CpaE
MRAGVIDVVPQPITRDDLLAALDYAALAQSVAQAAEGVSRAKTIAFVKGGGGVGATILAVQSACVLADKGTSNEAVACLLDFDFQFGTAALYLDLPGKADYHELVAAPERLDGALLRGMMSKHSSGLEVLAAPAEVLPLDTLTPEFISAALNIATREFKYVLMDMPEAWTNWSYRALQGAELIIVVTQLTVAGVRQARRQLDTLAAQGIEESRVRMALNRFEPGWGKSVRVREAEKALGHKVDFFIVNDYATVSEAINQGVALSRIKARSKVEKCIRKMIEDSVAAATDGAEARAEPQFS